MVLLQSMKRVLFIGQAPPQNIQERPFGRTRLYKWLEEAGILESQQKNFCFGALVDIFPGKNKSGSGDRVPNPEEIEVGRKQLAVLIKKTKPDIIITVGVLSARMALQKPTLKLEEMVGKSFTADAYNLIGNKITIIPLPHPSGASRWVWQGNNGKLVKKALILLAKNI